MLSVLLSIIKIIGWILLVIVIVLLVLTAAVLLIPVRYRIALKKDSEFFVSAKFSWLLWLVYVKLVYIEKKLSFRIRLFGICVFDSGRPKRKKGKKGKKSLPSEKPKEADPKNTSVPVLKPQHRAAENKEDSRCFESEPVKEKKRRVKKIIEKLLAFIKTKENKDGAMHFFRFLKKLLMHVKPKNISGYVIFGFDDPAKTGEVLGIASLFLNLYPDKLRIIPDFEKSRLEAEITCNGRIRMIRLLIIGLGAVRDKKIKKLIGNAKKLKEDL